MVLFCSVLSNEFKLRISFRFHIWTRIANSKEANPFYSLPFTVFSLILKLKQQDSLSCLRIQFEQMFHWFVLLRWTLLNARNHQKFLYEPWDCYQNLFWEERDHLKQTFPVNSQTLVHCIQISLLMAWINGKNCRIERSFWSRNFFFRIRFINCF